METEIPATDQLILYHNRELSEMVDSALLIDMYPKRLLVDQLFVYSKERMDRQNLTLPDLRKSFLISLNLSNVIVFYDYQLICSFAY